MNEEMSEQFFNASFNSILIPFYYSALNNAFALHYSEHYG